MATRKRKIYRDARDEESESGSGRKVGTRQRGRIVPTPPHKILEPIAAVQMPEAPALETFIAQTRDQGKAMKEFQYNSDADATTFGYIYLMKKYQSRCFIPGMLKFYPVLGKLKYIVNQSIYNKAGEIGRDLLECIHANVETIFIPLEIYLLNENGTIAEHSHANMLIYRPFKKIVDRFEPGSPEDDSALNQSLKTLFEETLRDKLGEYAPRYKSPLHMCPTLEGLQDVDEAASDKRAEEDGGYCQMWSLFMMEALLMNPRMSTADIIEECFRVSAANPKYLRRLMRGYVFNISKEIEEYTGYDIKTGELKHKEHSVHGYYQAAIDRAHHHKTQRTSPAKEVRAEHVDDKLLVKWAKLAKKLKPWSTEDVIELYSNVKDLDPEERRLKTRKDYEIGLAAIIISNNLTIKQLLELVEEEIIDLL